MTGIDTIRRHAAERHWKIVNCDGRELLVNDANHHDGEHVIAEIVGPYSEQLQALINEDVPALLAEIDWLNEVVRSAEKIISRWPASR
ncbi:hypothetical protein [Nonomuraea sediminis]|uniref:hypothetical protein n=1 Tax=Nonomuraea sediminis TaxID=2835864 RepID=UPI001BDCC9CB|nr:hypothetical protein [Nonomuraea sediminis]